MVLQVTEWYAGHLFFFFLNPLSLEPYTKFSVQRLENECNYEVLIDTKVEFR